MPTTMDSNDSRNKVDASEFEMSDCIQELNSDDLTCTGLAADRCGGCGVSSHAEDTVIKNGRIGAGPGRTRTNCAEA